MFRARMLPRRIEYRSTVLIVKYITVRCFEYIRGFEKIDRTRSPRSSYFTFFFFYIRYVKFFINVTEFFFFISAFHS